MAHRDEAGLCLACAHSGEPKTHPTDWRMPFAPVTSIRLEPAVWPLDIDEALEELNLSWLQHLT